MIAKGSTPLKAAKGDHQPVAASMRGHKIFGWHSQTVSGEGTISLDGAYNVPPDALVIDGKCEQWSTTGKNLFDMFSAPVFNNGSVVVSRLGTAITITNIQGNPSTCGVWAVIPVSEVGASVVVSGFVTAIGATKAQIILGYVTADGLTRTVVTTKTFSATESFSIPLTVNHDYDDRYIGVWLYANTSDTTVNGYATYDKIQVELGSTATAYEPYTGGIPSPNPSYPQPITTITGDLTITAANGALGDTVVTPLGSVELCSLPDGTKDSYDAVTGVVTKRADKVVFDGSADEEWNRGTNPFVHYTILLPSLSINTSIYLMCDRYTGSSSISDGCYIANGGKSFYVRNPSYGGADVAAWRTWLAANPVTVYYKLAEPYTIQLTPDLPVVRTGIKTLTVSANITPSFTATVKAMD